MGMSGHQDRQNFMEWCSNVEGELEENGTLYTDELVCTGEDFEVVLREYTEDKHMERATEIEVKHDGDSLDIDSDVGRDVGLDEYRYIRQNVYGVETHGTSMDVFGHTRVSELDDTLEVTRFI